MASDPTVIIKDAFPNRVFQVNDIIAIDGNNHVYQANGTFTKTDIDDDPLEDILDPETVKEFFPDTNFDLGDVLSFEGRNYQYSSNNYFMRKDSPGVGGSTGGGGSGGGGGGFSVPKINTPPTWDTPLDARKLPGAGTYPNYWSHKTRSGHLLMMDDSKGAENITIQHRGGSMIQMDPQGRVHIRTQNGRYDVTFGENRIRVSGAQDITVEGAASLRCEKDYNVTVKGKFNLTTSQDFNIQAKNFNVNASGNIHMQGKSMTAKIKENIAMLAHGAIAVLAKSGFTAGSTRDSTVIVGQKDVGIGANQGNLMLKSGSKMSLLSKTSLAMKAEGGKLSASASGDVAVDAGGNIEMQSGQADAPDDAKNIVVEKPEISGDVADFTSQSFGGSAGNLIPRG